MNSEEELRGMVELLNEKAFGRPGEERRLELLLHDRPDLEGVVAFIVLQPKSLSVYHPPAITLCWGGGRTAEDACGVVLGKFADGGGDILRKFLPFTAGSLDELKVKAAIYYG